MKRSLIITAMLVAALQISAQSNNRSRTTTVESASTASKTEKARNTSKQEKTEKKTATRQSSSSTPSSAATRENRSTLTGPQSEKISSQPTTSSRNMEVGKKTSTSQPAVNPQRRVSTTQSEINNRSAQSSARTATATAQPAANPERRVSTTPRQSTTAGRESVRPTRSTSTRTSNNVITGSEATSRSAQSSRGTVYTPRTAPKYEEARKSYETPARKTIVRTTYHTGYIYRPVEYRRVHYPYRSPAQINIYWSLPMYHQYRTIYPDYKYWHYPIGYRINTVSAYDAGFYIGELARIYGRIEYVWYSRPTNEYYLYFGGHYPYQDFSVIIPASVARRFNRRPERFFTNRHIVVTGLVSRWEGKPEMLIKRVNQVDIY